MDIISGIQKNDNLLFTIVLLVLLITTSIFIIFPGPDLNIKFIKKYLYYLIILIISFIMFYLIDLETPTWVFVIIGITLFPLIFILKFSSPYKKK